MEKYVNVNFNNEEVAVDIKNVNVDDCLNALNEILCMLEDKGGMSKERALAALTHKVAESRNKVDYEPYNATLCCVKSYGDDFTVGNIYHVENGILMGDMLKHGRDLFGEKPFKDLNDINDKMVEQFVEVK